MKIFTVRARLVRATNEFLGRYGLGLSLSGKVYLSFLVTKAAVRIVRDGRVDDLETAEESFHKLILEASGGLPVAETGPGLATH